MTANHAHPTLQSCACYRWQLARHSPCQSNLNCWRNQPRAPSSSFHSISRPTTHDVQIGLEANTKVDDFMPSSQFALVVPHVPYQLVLIHDCEIPGRSCHWKEGNTNSESILHPAMVCQAASGCHAWAVVMQARKMQWAIQKENLRNPGTSALEEELRVSARSPLS